MQDSHRRQRTQRLVKAITIPTALVLSVALVSGCGSRDSDTASGSNAKSCVDTSKDTIKIGSLHSLTGTMAISEVTVANATKMAVDQINAAGGVMGKKIDLVLEDGASDPKTFAEKAEKLISSDCVAAVFGGWTSSSRKAMKPKFETLNSLLYYPVQYEGLEDSKNIFYTGATTNQQIVPALDYLKQKGITSSTWSARTTSSRRPPTARSRRTPRPTASRSRARTTRRWAPPISPQSSTRSATPRRARSSTPSTATPMWRSSASTPTRA